MNTDLAQQIKIITILNPLEVQNYKEDYTEFKNGMVLADVIPEDMECVVAVSGGIVAVEDWNTYVLNSDDTVVISPVLRGGGGGSKNILRLVAFVALAYFTAGIANGSFLGGMTGAAAAGGMTAASVGLAAGVYVAGSLLINAILPAPKPSASSGDLAESATYGNQGPQNTSLEGVPVPVVYGKNRMAGNIIGIYVESYAKTQYLNMLLCAGEGPVANIDDIRVNDTNIDSYQDILVKTSLGLAIQEPPEWFGDSYVPMSIGGVITVPKWDPANPAVPTDPLKFIDRVTSQEVDGFRLDFVAPLGLLEIDKKGNQKQHSVELRVFYRMVADSLGTEIPGEPWMTGLLSGTTTAGDPNYRYIDPTPNPGEPEVPLRAKSVSNVVNGSIASIIEPTTITQEGDTEISAIPPTTIESTDPKNLSGTGVTEWDTATWYEEREVEPGLHYPVTETIEETVRPGTYVDGQGVIIDSTTGQVVGQVNPTYVEGVGETSGDPGSFNGMTSVFSAKSRMPVRLTLKSPSGLPQGHYQIRIGRKDDPQYETDENISDLVQLENIYEIIADNVSYKNTATVAVRVKMSDQINSTPTITFINHGVIIKTWSKAINDWVWAPSANPAWVLLDMLTNTRYGGSIPMDQIDLDAFRQWAKYCDTRPNGELEFNAVLDQNMNIWDAMRMVCRAGHAQIVRVGSRFSVIVEKADTPVMMFSEANIITDSFRQSWIGLSERANAINVTYFDRNYNWEKKEVRVVSPLITPGSEEITAELTLYGVTNRERAVADAWLQLNLNNWVTRTIDFEANLDAIACSVGSLILVKHVGVNYQISGRLSQDSPATGTVRLYLDQQVNWTQPPSSYKAMIHIPAFNKELGATGAGSIISYETKDRLIYVSGWNNGNTTVVDLSGGVAASGKITHLDIYTSGGVYIRALKVDSVTVINSSSAVIKMAEEIDGVQAGQKIRPVFGDLLIERQISDYGYGVDGGPDWVELSGTWTSPTRPRQFDHFMIGPVTYDTKKYRVLSITGNGSEYTRTISAIEYHDEIHDFSGFVMPPDPDGSAPTDPGDNWYSNGRIGPVRYLPGEAYPGFVRSRWRRGDGVYPADAVYDVSFGWQRPLEGNYAGAHIYMRWASGKDLDTIRPPDYVDGSDPLVEAAITTFMNQRADWVQVGSVVGEDAFGFHKEFNSLLKGSRVQFRVQAFDTKSARCPISLSPKFPQSDAGVDPIGLAKSGSEVIAAALTASNGFRSVGLKWTISGDSDFYRGAHIYVSAPGVQIPDTNDYVLPSSDFGLATKLTTVYFRQEYTNFLSDGAPRYYWVKAIDLAGDEQTTPTGPVEGKALSTPSELLGGDFGDLEEFIQNLINNTPNIVRYEDYTELNDRVLQLLSDYTVQSGQIAGLEADSVDYLGRISTLETTVDGDGVNPSLASRIDLLVAQYNLNTAAITTEQTARADADTALSSQISVLTTQVDGNTAAIATEQSVRSTQDAALATQISVMGTRVDNAEAAILLEQQTRSDADTAISTQISSVTARMDDAEAAIQSEESARVAADLAEAVAREAVSAQVATKNTIFRQAEAPTASGRVPGDLWYDTDDGNKLYAWVNGSGWVENSDARVAMAQAAVASEAQARADADSAMASDINQINAQITDGGTGLVALSNIVNSIQTEVSSIDGVVTSHTNEINLIQNKVTSRARTFAQIGAPTGSVEDPLAVNDLWIDTDDSNKMYRWNGTAWEDVSYADGITTTVGPSAPASPNEGDIWFDNTNPNGIVQYRYGGPVNGWVAMRDVELVGAVTDITNLQTQVSDQNGDIAAALVLISQQGAQIAVKNQTYVSGSTPTGGTYTVGDLWIDTSNGNRLNRWNGSAWLVLPNRENTMTFVTTGANPTAPVNRGFVTGDIWFKGGRPNGGYDQYRWNGSSWALLNDETALSVANRTTSLETFNLTNKAVITEMSALRAQLITDDGITLSGAITQLRNITLGADGSSTARASLEVDVNGRVVGYTINNNGSSGNFAVKADRFSIVNPVSGATIYNFSTDVWGGGNAAFFYSTLAVSGGRLSVGNKYTGGVIILDNSIGYQSSWNGGPGITSWGIDSSGVGINTFGVGSFVFEPSSTGVKVANSNVSAQNGIVVTSGNVGTYAAPPSDLRLKSNFEEITNALEIIQKIGTYTHTWDQEACEDIGYTPTSEKEYGVIAQEILDVTPEVVVESGYGSDILAVKYEKLVPLLIKAIQEQQTQIDHLKSLING